MRLFCLALGLLLLTSCAASPLSAQKSGELVLARVLGQDAHGDMRTISVLTEGASESGSLSAVSESAAGSVAALRAKSDRRIWFGHADTLMLSESVLKEGADSALAFLEPAEIRKSVKLCAVFGADAEEALASPGSELWKRLGAWEDNMSGYAKDPSVSASQLIRGIGEKGAELMPAYESGADGELHPAGLAALSADSLLGRFEDEQELGALLLSGRLKGGGMTLRSGDSVACVEIEKSCVKAVPLMENGELSALRIEIGVEAGLGEIQGSLDGAEALDVFERELAEYLLGAASSTLEKARGFGADCFGLGQRARYGAPFCTELGDGAWPELFPDIPMETVLTATLSGRGGGGQDE